MLLIYNTIENLKARFHFDMIASERIFKGEKFDIIHLNESKGDLEKYTHLLLTGSELSASKGSPYDKSIYDLIEHFMKGAKAIYGICHGHQMIAKFLAGDKICRKALVPEFGFKEMRLKEDPLFYGLEIPIFFSSRYDEVINLPKEFEIIAENETEAVQAFRYKDLPVWGTQFHPEFLREDGNDSLQKHLKENPQDIEYYRDDWSGKDYEPESIKIFNNFLKGK